MMISALAAPASAAPAWGAAWALAEAQGGAALEGSKREIIGLTKDGEGSAGAASGQGKAKRAGLGPTGTRGPDGLELSEDAKALVAKLQARDAQVRAHEAAHVAAGAGVVTGGASFSYQRGPDGRSYAVGGEVGVDASPVDGNPDATIAKAQRVVAAALAPADPSATDLAVAAKAATMMAQASAEKAAKANRPFQGERPEGPGQLMDTLA